MVAGPSVDRHHWVPRSRNGPNDAATVHVVCHRMVHRLFTEAELAARFSTPEAIRAHPDMRRFIAWVRRRPPDYVDWPQAPRGHGRRPAKRR
ncbi:MAG: HNH endonuclease [Rhodospirillaceae bacterium]|nr:HNH endonuclease [Rhodospirillaceae bacterium]